MSVIALPTKLNRSGWSCITKWSLVLNGPYARPKGKSVQKMKVLVDENEEGFQTLYEQVWLLVATLLDVQIRLLLLEVRTLAPSKYCYS